MGKRARRRGDSGKGTRQRYKERQLGLHLSGLTKPVADALNDVSLELYGLGIGVMVQEEDRERRKVASLREERKQLRRWEVRKRWRVNRTLRAADAAQQVWSHRLQEVSARVAGEADPREVENWRAARA